MRSKSRSPSKLSEFLSIPRSQTANFSYQSISKVPQHQNVSIKKLCLNNNKLSNLVGIQMYTELKQLDISQNTIKTWNELKRITKNLQVLVAENNPFEVQPNYLYNIVLFFPSIKKINRLFMNEQLRRDIIDCQRVIAHKLLHWLIHLHRMDQRLTRTFCSPQLKIENIQDYQDAVEALENQRKLLVSQFDPLFKLKNESMFIKNMKLKQLLQRQDKISFSTSERQSVQQNYFQYLICIITRSSKTLVQHLLSEIRVPNKDAQKQLVGNQSLMYKQMFFHFKKMWMEQTSPLSNNILSQISQQYQDIFPYCSLDQVYVQSVYKSFIDILQNNIKKIDQSIEHVIRSQPRDLHERKSIQIKYIGDGLHRSTWMSDNSLRRTLLRMDEIDQNAGVQFQQDYGDYLPLCRVIIRLGEKRLKRQFYQKLRRCRKKVSYTNVNEVMYKLQSLKLRRTFEALNRLQNYNYECQLIQKHYWNRRLKLMVFQQLKRLSFIKQYKLQLIRTLVTKKQRSTKMMIAYSFKRWKLMSSRTLKYISSLRKSLYKSKQDAIDQQYRKIIKEKLGQRRRATTFYEGPYKSR